MNNNPNDTRLNYDECSYEEKLKRSIGPGLYNINVPSNDCTDCGLSVPNDPSLRYQKYGLNTCSISDTIDDSNELKGLNYKNSKCNDDNYLPDKYNQKFKCNVKFDEDPRKCFTPQESTRLSNPSNTLRCTGINRWQWLYEDPQQFALENFNRVPTNYRMVAKDNHIPLFENPDASDDKVKPDSQNLEVNPSDSIDSWGKGLSTHPYAPGNPNGVINYNFACI